MTFRFRSAADLVAAYRDGATTPAAVAERALAAAAALDRSDPPMRLFIALDEVDVRRQAARATARWRAGEPLGPLDGVPVAIKDEIDVAGYRTTCGTSFLGEQPAASDARSVARLRRGGAILFGKTNMHELGVSPSGLNPFHGTARNPYDPARDTGGSSSGSAGAVAAGIVPIALGNDGGGSLRIPGSLCGVPSIKPTYGRVPTEGVAVLCWSLEHSGPIGATVEDVATAMAVICDEPLALEPAIARPASGRPLRIGVCEAWWRWARPDVAAIARATVDALARRGAEVVSLSLPHVDLALPVGIATFGVEGAVSVEPHLRAGRPLGRAVRLAFDLARGVSATTFVKAQRARALIARDFEAALDRCDVIATPTTATTARAYHADALTGGELDEANTYAMVRFTFATNLTGHPSAQVPCGHDASGMPVGLQLIAAHGRDALALSVAAAVEAETERRRPVVWSDLLA